MAKILQKIKNFGRKMLVKLKYHPNFLPMLVMFVAFVVFSLNLKSVSGATLYINKDFIGLYQFVSYLLSILSMVALMNAFPRREKVKIPFIVLTFIMIAIIIFTNIMYVSLIDGRFIIHNDGTNPIKDPAKITELASAKTSYIVNIVFEVVALILLALVPVIKKVMAKVNTRVQLEENENISTIDISND